MNWCMCCRYFKINDNNLNIFIVLKIDHLIVFIHQCLIVLQIAVDAAAGILHLHRQGIVHRDIAARNIFLDGQYRGKVCSWMLLMMIWF